MHGRCDINKIFIWKILKVRLKSSLTNSRYIDSGLPEVNSRLCGKLRDDDFRFTWSEIQSFDWGCYVYYRILIIINVELGFGKNCSILNLLEKLLINLLSTDR